MSKHSILSATFAASLIFAVASPSLAQKPAKLNPRELEIAAEAAIGRDPRLAAERDELDRQMFEMRQSLVRDAINRMNNRRFDINNSSAEVYRRILGDIAII